MLFIICYSFVYLFSVRVSARITREGYCHRPNRKTYSVRFRDILQTLRGQKRNVQRQS